MTPRANTHHLSALRQTAREKWRAALLLPPDCNDKEPAHQCLQTDSHPPRGTAAAKLIASRTHAAERTPWYGQATGKRDLNAQLWEFNSAWSFSVLFFCYLLAQITAPQAVFSRLPQQVVGQIYPNKSSLLLAASGTSNTYGQDESSERRKLL